MGPKEFEKEWGKNIPRSPARILVMACAVLYARSGGSPLLGKLDNQRHKLTRRMV